MRTPFALLPVVAALCLASGMAQAVVTVRNSAEFVPFRPGQIQLLGFGRVGSEQPTPDGLANGSGANVAPGFESFFDIWNIQVGAVAPGDYAFSDMTVNAVGGLRFDSMVFNSYDAAGQRHSVFFTVDDAGTQAVGSGAFTVLASCPVASCVWIDVIGEQPIGTLDRGYGGDTIAVVVPEPAMWSSMLFGLGALGWAVRRRRDATV
jgi:hypothetical protein